MTGKEALAEFKYQLLTKEYTRKDIGVSISRLEEIIRTELDKAETLDKLIKEIYDAD